MPQVTIDQVVRARNSARRRMGTLRTDTRGFFSRKYTSPIDDVNVFDDSIKRIEREYQDMLARIENATVNL